MANTEAQNTTDPWWAPLWRFAIHVVAATGLFILVAAPAVLLELLVRLLRHHDVGSGIIGGLQLAEYTIFGIDVLLLVSFVVKSAWRAFKEF